MSNDKPIVKSEASDHDDSIGRELEMMHAEMTSIRIDLPSTAERRDDGEEIAAAALGGTSDHLILRINVYENIPFAGGEGDYSILSVLFGLHLIGGGIFSFLTMIDSNKVRVQCVECRDAVMDFPWMDIQSRIKGNIKAWRAAFPVARAVNVSYRNDIVDADFVHIRGDARVRLHTVNMWKCKRVTDAAFVHLRGIHTLNIMDCNQATITDSAFIHLRGIHTLRMSGCNQATITDSAFIHLRGIHTLNMSFCDQATIIDAAFVHLRGITLLISFCDKATIITAALAHLHGIHSPCSTINTFSIPFCQNARALWMRCCGRWNNRPSCICSLPHKYLKHFPRWCNIN